MKIDRTQIEERAAMHKPLKFDVTEEEHELLERIVDRANKLHMKYAGHPAMAQYVYMDIVACHRNGCPLKLAEMLEADDFNFTHDVFGIQDYLDRKTGKLTRCFLPRFYNGEEDKEGES